MKNVIELDVTAPGREYFRHWFDGLPGLCARMLPFVASQGRISAIVPEGTSEARAIQFTAGGLGEFCPLSGWLIPHVTDRLKESARGILLHQDIWAKSSDVQPSAPPFIVSENPDAVYYFVTADQLSLSTFEACLWAPLSFVTAMLVIPDFKLSLQKNRHVLEAVELEALASGVTEMIATAYDQESYLIWRKPSE
jgi:hypothetical protein